MKDTMKYKDYFGSVHYDSEDEIFHGRIEFIRDLVTFEASDAKSLKAAFVEAVDDYLETCKEIGKEPDQPFKGSFNVRTSSQLHRDITIAAKERGLTLNKIISEALEEYLRKIKSSKTAA